MELFFPVIILGIAQTESKNSVGQLPPLTVVRVNADKYRTVASTLYLAGIRRHDTHGVSIFGE
jgi:hypothetical protein